MSQETETFAIAEVDTVLYHESIANLIAVVPVEIQLHQIRKKSNSSNEGLVMERLMSVVGTFHLIFRPAVNTDGIVLSMQSHGQSIEGRLIPGPKAHWVQSSSSIADTRTVGVELFNYLFPDRESRLLLDYAFKESSEGGQSIGALVIEITQGPSPSSSWENETGTYLVCMERGLRIKTRYVPV